MVATSFSRLTLAGKSENTYPLSKKEKMIGAWRTKILKSETEITPDAFSGFVNLFVESSKTTMLDLVNISKTIPIRLDANERALLDVLLGALTISEYTDKVDNSVTYGRRKDIVRAQLDEMFSFILGLCISQNPVQGKKQANAEMEELMPFFGTIFEIGRRYKIMNPCSMRGYYGKLMWMIQDRGMIADTKLNKSIRCVYSFLEEKKGLELLSHPGTAIVTQTIRERDPEKIKQIKATIEVEKKHIYSIFVSESLDRDSIDLCLDSIRDHNAQQFGTSHAIDRLIYYLHTYFHPFDNDPSLAIYQGSDGSCLTHTHYQQFKFVHQTLQFWKEVSLYMNQLWICADKDLLESTGYSLVNTGQGFNRMQGSPRVAEAMQRILGRVQHRVGDWVGLSVIHLGDRDVPNALVFIDKYTQVSHILQPIVTAIENARQMSNDPDSALFLIEFGGFDGLCQTILGDFFRHGFDGSGDDGGSCIDGRLTSAWNWCSKLHKKKFYPIFMLSGFQGFDGSFRR